LGDVDRKGKGPANTGDGLIRRGWGGRVSSDRGCDREKDDVSWALSGKGVSNGVPKIQHIKGKNAE